MLKNITTYSTLVLLVLLSTSSCLKKEKLYPRPNVPDGTITETVAMGENYENQVYFDFETGRNYANSPTTWDLGFSYFSNKVIINGGKHQELLIAKLGKLSFDDLIYPDTIAKVKWVYDHPDGSMDFNAVGNIFKKTTVNPFYFETDSCMYLIKLGDNSLGDKQFVKIQFLSRNGLDYRIKWAYLNQTSPNDIFIPTDEFHNYTYYCFSCAQGITDEPVNNNQWDILFTTYKQFVTDNTGITLDYLLRGVLSNETNTEVYNVTGLQKYDDINLTYAKSLTYNGKLNNIGYDWKLFSIQANKYTINKDNAYIIKNRNGVYFKMKFVDFYNDLDQKGYPKMAYQVLK